MRCWCGYQSGTRCKWFADGPAGTTVTASSLVSLKSRMAYLSGASLPMLFWEICFKIQGAPIKNNPLGKIHYLSYCNKFFHQIYSFHTGGLRPHTQQILLQYLLWFKIFLGDCFLLAHPVYLSSSCTVAVELCAKILRMFYVYHRRGAVQNEQECWTALILGRVQKTFPVARAWNA